MKKHLEAIDPLYLKLLGGAIVIFIIGVCMMFSDLYYKVGTLEHTMAHMPAVCPRGALR